jgi:hypothetical protein
MNIDCRVEERLLAGQVGMSQRYREWLEQGARERVRQEERERVQGYVVVAVAAAFAIGGLCGMAVMVVL